jgi:hypothetical protein
MQAGFRENIVAEQEPGEWAMHKVSEENARLAEKHADISE